MDIQFSQIKNCVQNIRNSFFEKWYCSKFLSVSEIILSITFVVPSVLPRNFIGGDKRPISSKYCGTVLIKQGTNDEKKKKKQMQISWDNVPLSPGTFGNFM